MMDDGWMEMRSRCGFDKFCYTTNGLPVCPVVVVPVGVAAVEVQVVGVAAVALVGSTAPVVAVVGLIVERAVVVVAVTGSREENRYDKDFCLYLLMLYAVTLNAIREQVLC
jgi:hypothetical protein